MRLFLVWAATCLIWSTVWLFIKIGVRDLPPLSFAGLRLLIALLVLTPIMIVRRQPFPRGRRTWTLLASTGFLLLAVNYGLVFWGACYVSSGLMCVLQAMTPVFGAMFTRSLLPGERVTLSDAGALAFGVGGVAVIFSDQMHVGGGSLLGAAAVTLGSICVAAAYVIVKASRLSLAPATITFGQMTCGMIPLLLAGALREPPPWTWRWTPAAVAALLYLALAGSIAAFWLNYWLLQRMRAASILWMSIVEPPIAVLLGVAILHEPLNGRIAAGGAAVLVGLVMTMTRRPQQ